MTNIAIMQCAPYTSGMSAALGAYLVTLRKGRKLEPKDVLPVLSKQLGKKVDHSRLWRAENGGEGRWPDGDFLLALLDVIGGDIADIIWIQRNPDAKPQAGQERAYERLKADEPMSPEERELVDRLTKLKGDRRQAAIVVLRDLLAAEEQNGAR